MQLEILLSSIDHLQKTFWRRFNLFKLSNNSFYVSKIGKFLFHCLEDLNMNLIPFFFCCI